MSIESHRGALGMSKKALAEAIGSTVRSVYHWEAGKRSPDKKFVQRMARVFGCSMDELTSEILDDRRNPYDE